MRVGKAAPTIDIEEYYRRYGPMVLRRCRSLLKDEQEALDAMQDTFVQLIRYHERLRPEAPSSLLYQIATNICLNRIRASRRRPEDPNDELLQRIAATGEPEPGLIGRIFLNRLFEREAPSTRSIAVLYYLDRLTLEEVAREAGLSVSGVRKRLRSLRARLKKFEGD